MSLPELPAYMQVSSLPTTSTDETAEAGLSYLKFNLNNCFILKQGGEEKKLGSEVKIVILGINPPKNFINARAYWPGKFGDTDAEQPVCASPNGVNPYPFLPSEDKQSEVCETCKWSKLGSSISQGKGGKASQCKSFKMIFFCFADDLETMLSMRIPVTSLKNLSQHRWDVKKVNARIASVVTKVGFDIEAEYTVLKFSFDSFLNQEEFLKCTERAVGSELKALMAGPNSQAATPAVEDKTDQNSSSEDTSTVSEGYTTVDKWLEESAGAKPEQKAAKKITVPQGAACNAELDEDFDDAALGTPYAIFTGALLNFDSVLNLKTYATSAGKSLLAQMSSEELAQAKIEFRKRAVFLNQKAKETPLEAAKKAIANVMDKAQLPDILQQIRAVVPEGATLMEAFTNKASELNNVSFSTAFHGLSKDGFPALIKDGSFKLKRGAQQRPIAQAAGQEVATSAATSEDSTMTDILDDLDLEEL